MNWSSRSCNIIINMWQILLQLKCIDNTIYLNDRTIFFGLRIETCPTLHSSIIESARWDLSWWILLTLTFLFVLYFSRTTKGFKSITALEQKHTDANYNLIIFTERKWFYQKILTLTILLASVYFSFKNRSSINPICNNGKSLNQESRPSVT